MKFYKWLVFKLFKKRQVNKDGSPKAAFQRYCEDNPSSKACRIYDV